VERFGFEAVYGASGTTLRPDGSIEVWTREGIPASDFARFKVILKAESDVRKAQQKKSEAKAKAARKR